MRARAGPGHLPVKKKKGRKRRREEEEGEEEVEGPGGGHEPVGGLKHPGPPMREEKLAGAEVGGGNGVSGRESERAGAARTSPGRYHNRVFSLCRTTKLRQGLTSRLRSEPNPGQQLLTL